MIFNLLDCELEESAHPRDGHRFLRAMLGQAAGATHTGCSVYELPPGETAWAYHYELNREEWLIVVAGEVVVRTPAGEETLRAGDVTSFPVGEHGAHQVRNDSSAPARFAMPSSCGGRVRGRAPGERHGAHRRPRLQAHRPARRRSRLLGA